MTRPVLVQLAAACFFGFGAVTLLGALGHLTAGALGEAVLQGFAALGAASAGLLVLR